MTFLRRAILIILVFLIPLVLAETLHTTTIALIEMTDRVINPVLLRYAAIAEFTAIFTICFMEARDRW